MQQQQQQQVASESLPDDDRLNGLPLELQLHIANAVGERCDRAALILASPRLLGLAACRQLPSYQGLEMSLLVGGAIDEKVLRRYASRSEATPEGCKWLAGVAATAGLPKCKIIVWPPRFHPVPDATVATRARVATRGVHTGRGHCHPGHPAGAPTPPRH